jgi:hypothetical protein
MSNYARIIKMGPQVQQSPLNDPLSYCAVSGLDNMFMHTAGQRLEKNSKECQMFMSDRCASNWDGICEIASMDGTSWLPNQVTGKSPLLSTQKMTQGDYLVRNTLAKKYLTEASSKCNLSYRPFDYQVPTSPMIREWATAGSQTCEAIYEVDPLTVDACPIMNKALMNPAIVIDILINIYNQLNRTGRMSTIKNTKLYRFFISAPFQQYVRN